MDATLLSEGLGLMSDQNIPEGMPPVGVAVGMQASDSGSGLGHCHRLARASRP